MSLLLWYKLNDNADAARAGQRKRELDEDAMGLLTDLDRMYSAIGGGGRGGDAGRQIAS